MKVLKDIGVNVNNGLGDLYEKIKKLDAVTKEQIENDIKAQYEDRPWLAMVNSAKGM